MPLYEFECKKCRTIFEELVRMGSTGEGLRCPSCGAGRVKKRMSTFYGRASNGSGGHHHVGGGCGRGGNCASCDGSCSCHG